MDEEEDEEDYLATVNVAPADGVAGSVEATGRKKKKRGAAIQRDSSIISDSTIDLSCPCEQRCVGFTRSMM